jgi:Arylsulfatase A and related enzymes
MNYMKRIILSFLSLFIFNFLSISQDLPNIVFIYADDLGYGDVSCYGATKIITPNIDRIAKEGISFTNAHTASATCTPSRFSLLTGEYAWRRKGTGIARGNASLIMNPSHITFPRVLQNAGYKTGIIGKWHLGLGDAAGPNWNGEIKPGPIEVGFDYSYIMAATLDRVPTVFIENHRIMNWKSGDPIEVNYDHKVGNAPTGKENPELLRMKPSNGHSNTIVNGISRIGWMTGGYEARWTDQNIADTFTQRAINFIELNKQHPFFLYFASGDPHVPRDPNQRFVGKSGMGPRGDAILQLDWSVGQILQTLERLGLKNNTMVIFTSDNGPVVDDGYHDQAVELLNGHTPWGPFSGGKYSIFEAGTRVPFIVSWPGKIPENKKSNALLSQVDMLASFASFTNQPFNKEEAIDSRNMVKTLLGKTKKGRNHLIEDAGTLAIIQGYWKYIEPGDGQAIDTFVNIKLGNSPLPQLYNLKNDEGEQNNLATRYPKKVKKLAAELEKVKNKK